MGDPTPTILAAHKDRICGAFRRAGRPRGAGVRDQGADPSEHDRRHLRDERRQLRAPARGPDLKRQGKLDRVAMSISRISSTRSRLATACASTARSRYRPPASRPGPRCFGTHYDINPRSPPGSCCRVRTESSAGFIPLTDAAPSCASSDGRTETTTARSRFRTRRRRSPTSRRCRARPTPVT